ncbi:hypothetical protein Tco_0532884 [Tanacetum coccineum]
MAVVLRRHYTSFVLNKSLQWTFRCQRVTVTFKFNKDDVIRLDEAMETIKGEGRFCGGASDRVMQRLAGVLKSESRDTWIGQETGASVLSLEYAINN